MRRFNIKLCSTEPSNCDYENNIRKALLAGYFMQAAKLDTSGHYVTVKNQHVSSSITSSFGHCYVSFSFTFNWHYAQVVELHPSSSVVPKPAWVIYDDFVVAGRPFIRIVSDVQGEW